MNYIQVLMTWSSHIDYHYLIPFKKNNLNKWELIGKKTILLKYVFKNLFTWLINCIAGIIPEIESELNCFWLNCSNEGIILADAFASLNKNFT